MAKNGSARGSSQHPASRLLHPWRQSEKLDSDSHRPLGYLLTVDGTLLLEAFLMRGRFWYESATLKKTLTVENQSPDAGASAWTTTRVSYAPLCTVAGLVLAQLPRFLHGPIPYKFDIHALDGHVAVRAWYIARMLIGFLVGITRWPSRWWIRGPLCGLVMMVPLGFVSLATPECGPACMFWNSFTGAAIGLLVGAGAFWVTGRHRGP